VFHSPLPGVWSGARHFTLEDTGEMLFVFLADGMAWGSMAYTGLCCLKLCKAAFAGQSWGFTGLNTRDKVFDGEKNPLLRGTVSYGTLVSMQRECVDWMQQNLTMSDPDTWVAAIGST
jgi:hypothetical protein